MLLFDKMFFKEWGSLRGKTHSAYVEQSETKRHGLVQKNVVFPLKKYKNGLT